MTDIDELEERLDIALWNLQLEVACLSIMLPDLSDRHKQLIDNVLKTVADYGATRVPE